MIGDTHKLSDLPPEEQQEIVERRLTETKLLEQYAYRTMAACELTAQARLLAVHPEYSEDLEEEEL